MHPEQQLSIARNSEGATSMAVISVQGAALLKLVLNGVPVVDSSNLSNPLAIKFGSLLAPWPNRLAKGTYTFEDQQYQSARLDAYGNAIHGLLYDRDVQVENKKDSSVTFRHLFGQDPFYPFAVELSVTYELLEDELVVTAIAKNHGNSAPFGIGFHPYFLAGENFRVNASFTKQILVDENLIPNSSVEIEGIDYSGGHLDSCFVGSNLTRMTTDNFSIEVKLIEGYTHTMLYRPKLEVGESLIAIEPMSCPANAFNSDIESTVLKKLEKKKYVFSIKMN